MPRSSMSFAFGDRGLVPGHYIACFHLFSAFVRSGVTSPHLQGRSQINSPEGLSNLVGPGRAARRPGGAG
jgi:hypothetical protein